MKKEKILVACTAIAHYMDNREHYKAFYLLEKFIEPSVREIETLQSENAQLKEALDLALNYIKEGGV